MKNQVRYSLLLASALILATPATADQAPVPDWVKRRMSRIAMIPDVLQNSGFEEVDASGRVSAWSAGVHGGDSYRIASDESQLYEGKRSLVIENTGKPAWGGVMQVIRGEHLAGREIEFSAQVKAKGVTAPGFHLALKAMRGGQELTLVTSADVVTGDMGWRKISLHTRLAEEATHLELALILQGDGCAWMDDVRLQSLGEEIKVLPKNE